MTTIVQQLSGDICEPCYALSAGISPDYWEGNEETLDHCERAEMEWSELGHIVLDTGDNPESHFGNSCIVCGAPPYAGTVYSGTLVVFAAA